VKKRSFFSKKGNPPDYNYLAHQMVLTAIAAILVVLMVVGVRLFGG
jgi:hypothetical protein